MEAHTRYRIPPIITKFEIYMQWFHPISLTKTIIIPFMSHINIKGYFFFHIHTEGASDFAYFFHKQKCTLQLKKICQKWFIFWVLSSDDHIDLPPTVESKIDASDKYLFSDECWSCIWHMIFISPIKV